MFDNVDPTGGFESLNTLYYEAPELYDALYGTSEFDLAFWKKHAVSANGPVLELGCGSGRLTIPIAKDGIKITGVDRALPMLKLAREKTKAAEVTVRLILDDIRAVDLMSRFKLIMASANLINECLTA
ncbi:MAG: class I SAM-dependent methyltransferase, partial [Chthoniobacterales bacterium]|nr:class I SAM-dependent methyltransferase [Chthoniobacterales bacterium]